MDQQEKEFDKILRRESKEVVHSKAAARKFFKKLGILHLLVPKGTNKSPTTKSFPGTSR
jgi:hypothetical protein